MVSKPVRKFSGYVKVEVLSHHPRRWIWSVCRDGTHSAVMVGRTPLFSAESAWDAGRSALAALERGEAGIKAA
jgi:hypothetical protein